MQSATVDFCTQACQMRVIELKLSSLDPFELPGKCALGAHSFWALSAEILGSLSSLVTFQKFSPKRDQIYQNTCVWLAFVQCPVGKCEVFFLFRRHSFVHSSVFVICKLSKFVKVCKIFIFFIRIDQKLGFFAILAVGLPKVSWALILGSLIENKMATLFVLGQKPFKRFDKHQIWYFINISEASSLFWTQKWPSTKISGFDVASCRAPPLIFVLCQKAVKMAW